MPEPKLRSAAQGAARHSDISPRGLAIGAAIIAAGIAVSIGAAALIVRLSSAPATGPSGGEPPKVEGARLQTSAHQDLQAFLREKNGRLSSFGRVDDEHLHIPIERAMRILAKGREK
jgi:hypothetical protein